MKSGNGLGQLMSIEFAKLGAVIVAWDINDEGLNKTKRKFSSLRSKPLESEHFQINSISLKKNFVFFSKFTSIGLVEEAGSKCYIYNVDISSKENIYRAGERVKQEAGPVYMLINNAGIVSGKNFLDLKDEEIERKYLVL